MVVREEALKLFRLLAQLEPVEEQVGRFQPDPEPVGDFLLLAALFRIDARGRPQAFRALLALEDERANQACSDAVGDAAILAIKRVELAE